MFLFGLLSPYPHTLSSPPAGPADAARSTPRGSDRAPRGGFEGKRLFSTVHLTCRLFLILASAGSSRGGRGGRCFVFSIAAELVLRVSVQPSHCVQRLWPWWTWRPRRQQVGRSKKTNRTALLFQPSTSILIPWQCCPSRQRWRLPCSWSLGNPRKANMATALQGCRLASAVK